MDVRWYVSEFMAPCKYFFKTEAVEKNGGYKSSVENCPEVCYLWEGGDDVYFTVESSHPVYQRRKVN